MGVLDTADKIEFFLLGYSQPISESGLLEDLGFGFLFDWVGLFWGFFGFVWGFLFRVFLFVFCFFLMAKRCVILKQAITRFRSLKLNKIVLVSPLNS